MRRSSTLLLLSTLLSSLLPISIGCGTSDAGPDLGDCSYPAGATEPMAVGGVLSPYSWPVALQADRTETDLDLAEVHCSADEALDWSPFDMLLFVSIPGW